MTSLNSPLPILVRESLSPSSVFSVLPLRYILNYLRDGELLYPDDQIIKKQLLKEARFYQVQGIITHLEAQLFQIKVSSVVKDENHRSVLMSWLPPNASLSLLYRASSDGKTPADFHRWCDKKGPTLVLIRSGAYICGGYTSNSWQPGMC